MLEFLIAITAISIWLSQPNKQKTNQVDGVSMEIKEGTLTNTGATIIITDTTNKDYSYGEPYRIDKKENYLLDENNEIVREVNWEWIYGELTPGTYRFVTDASSNEISVEFTIE